MEKELTTSWNTNKLFNGITDPRIEEQKQQVNAYVSNFAEKWRNRNDYLEDVDMLYEALTAWEELWTNYGTDGHVGYYFSLLYALNQNDPVIKAKSGEIEQLAIKNTNKLSFFVLSLGKVSKENQEKFLKSQKLKRYWKYLERIFAEAKYHLTEGEERIVTMISSSAAGRWSALTSELLAKRTAVITLNSGKKVVKTVAELTEMQTENDKKLRDTAAKKLNAIFRSVSDVAEAEINSILEYSSAMRKLRGAKRPDEFRLFDDDIDPEVVEAMLTAVSSRYEIAHRYMKLKARLLKQDTLEHYERGVAFPVVEKEYSYKESVVIIGDVLESLDAEFFEIFTKFVNEGAIDVYPRKGKMSGAFCVNHMISDPTYILLNHIGKFRDVTTIAHEVGHGINSELMRKHQSALYFGTTLATAEVASTFFEDFVSEKLFTDLSKEQQIFMKMNTLNDDIATIFRQVACYQFEQEMHYTFEQKRFLSKKELGAMFKKHMSNYMGPAVSQKKGGDLFWIYWSHIRNHFYVYSYASGLLISKALQKNVRENSAFINKVKEFLAAGESKSPKDIFAELGIDITKPSFWHEGLDEVERLLLEVENLV
jgi:oligoendopeptidase F